MASAGASGHMSAAGMGEGWIATIVLAFGVLTIAAGAGVLALAWRCERASRRGYLARLVLGTTVGLAPWLVVATFLWPSTWRSPEEVDLSCFAHDQDDPMRQVGHVVEGTPVMTRVLAHKSTLSRDYVYVIPGPGGRDQRIPMSCATTGRCEPSGFTEEQLMEALRTLPDCKSMSAGGW
jgi:hypothetical protein